MTKYNIPLTYKPKIPKVLSGECTQTIRAGRKFKTGDLISFHGWEGKPYRSKWSFRTPYYTVVNLVPIIIKKEGIKVQSLYWGDQDMESGSKIAPLKLHPGLWEF